MSDTSLPLAGAPDAERLKGVPLVLLAGVLWSSAGIVIRLMDDATGWQILFYRSAALVPTLLLAIAVRNRGRVIEAFRRGGWNAVIGGLSLSCAFTGMIFAILHTTVANVLFILSTAPLIAALLGRIVLGERVRPVTWTAMAIAIGGVGVMVADSARAGGLSGNLIALGMACGFAGFTVTVRRRRQVDMFPAVCLAGVFAATLSGAMVERFALSPHDLALCVFLGTMQIGAGLVLYTLGARHLAAVEATLLSLTEVVLGPLWVWIGIGETPSHWTLAGGGLVLAAVIWQALAGARRPRPPVGLA